MLDKEVFLRGNQEFCFEISVHQVEILGRQIDIQVCIVGEKLELI